MNRVSSKRDSAVKPFPKQRARINPVSEKRKAENRGRAKVLREARAQAVGCELRAIHGCTDAMTDGHEVWTRGRGGPIDDRNNILMGCRPCHRWVTDHPLEADCQGFTIPAEIGAVGYDESRRVREARAQGKHVHTSWCKIQHEFPPSGV